MNKTEPAEFDSQAMKIQKELLRSSTNHQQLNWTVSNPNGSLHFTLIKRSDQQEAQEILPVSHDSILHGSTRRHWKFVPAAS